MGLDLVELWNNMSIIVKVITVLMIGMSVFMFRGCGRCGDRSQHDSQWTAEGATFVLKGIPLLEPKNGHYQARLHLWGKAISSLPPEFSKLRLTPRPVLAAEQRSRILVIRPHAEEIDILPRRHRLAVGGLEIGWLE